MDKLRFERKIIYNIFSGKGMVAAKVVINNVPFAEMAEDLERLAANSGGEKYHGFGYVCQIAAHLYDELAAVGKSCRYGDAVTLMICDACYEAGCWPIEFCVDISENVVTWSGFINPHRAETWNYGLFPSFTFDKHEYEKALVELRYFSKFKPTERETIQAFAEYRVNDVHARAKEILQSADFCGCFACMKLFYIDEVTEWEDINGEELAVCPYCRNTTAIGFRRTEEGEEPLGIEVGKNIPQPNLIQMHEAFICPEPLFSVIYHEEFAGQSGLTDGEKYPVQSVADFVGDGVFYFLFDEHSDEIDVTPYPADSLEIILPYKCPCCGKPAMLLHKGRYNVCRNCGWIDDPNQRSDPEVSGENPFSLTSAKWRTHAGKTLYDGYPKQTPVSVKEYQYIAIERIEPDWRMT